MKRKSKINDNKPHKIQLDRNKTGIVRKEICIMRTEDGDTVTAELLFHRDGSYDVFLRTSP